MSDGDIDRSTMRANLLEQKLFKLELAGIETSKKTVDVDTRKTQYDMKRRLKKYRERQRTILQAKAAASSMSMEELINKQLTERMARNRPKTSLPSSSSKGRESSDEELEGDRSSFTDQHRSKVDLRPKTARTLNGERFSKYSDVGRIGRASEETRYFDEDELKDRAFLYTKMIEIRKKKEQKQSHELKSKVLEFCGIDVKRKSSQQRWKSSSIPLNVVNRLANSRPKTPEMHAAPTHVNGARGFQRQTYWRQSKSANVRTTGGGPPIRPTTVSTSKSIPRLNLK